jgi:hypothetical protein
MHLNGVRRDSSLAVPPFADYEHIRSAPSKYSTTQSASGSARFRSRTCPALLSALRMNFTASFINRSTRESCLTRPGRCGGAVRCPFDVRAQIREMSWLVGSAPLPRDHGATTACESPPSISRQTPSRCAFLEPWCETLNICATPSGLVLDPRTALQPSLGRPCSSRSPPSRIRLSDALTQVATDPSFPPRLCTRCLGVPSCGAIWPKDKIARVTDESDGESAWTTFLRRGRSAIAHTGT